MPTGFSTCLLVVAVIAAFAGDEALAGALIASAAALWELLLPWLVG